MWLGNAGPASWIAAARGWAGACSRFCARPPCRDRLGAGRAGRVLDVLRGALLDRRDRLDDVAPLEGLAPVGVRVGQRHRADLLDHGWGLPVRDPRKLVPALLAVDLRHVVDLAEVEVEDVEPVDLR